MGTPIEAYNEDGTKVWEREIDIYGRARKENLTNFVPWLYQGQYVDTETGLAYNRFRYYDPSIGSYISQDPIGMIGKNPTMYGYVSDVNSYIDYYGLLVDAIFTVEGGNKNARTTGKNPLDRSARETGKNPGLSAPNSNKSTMHAEIEAMTGAKGRGVKGGDGILEIKGKNICPYCKGDVKKLARQMDLNSLTIIDADGSIYKFDKKGLLPVKEGGMGYKKAKVHSH